MPFAALCFALSQSPTILARKFVPTEKLAYTVASHITAQQRQRPLQSFIPSDLDLNYAFDFVVKSVSNDGIAVLDYRRPISTEIEGETADSPPKTKTEKSDKVFQLTVSPVNELIDNKDVTPAKPGKPLKKRGSGRWTNLGTEAAPVFQGGLLGQYIGEMHRLALFAGSIDSGLDFAPKLPLEPVKVGGTWQRTVGYQPQKLKGKDGKSAVQRLDYTYTYLGPVTSNGRPVLRIQAKLDLNTDLVDYVKTLLEGSNVETGLKSMPLRLKATIDFDLDPKTRHTLAAAATSEGGFELILTGETEPYFEEKFKGRTNLDLVGRKVGAKG